MSPNPVSVVGTVRAVEDAEELAATATGEKGRILTVHVLLAWKTGNPAGVLTLRLYCKNDRELSDEAVAWPFGCRAKVTVERPETEG